MRSLTNVVFKNHIRKDMQSGKKTVFLDGLAFLIVFVSLATAMVYFSYTITLRLNEMDQGYAFVNILFLMNFIILFTKSVFESLNVLYFSKDLKFLLRMPLKSQDILHGKIFNMIISEYPMEIIMLAIPLIVYGILQQVSSVFYVYMLIILLILPIIPIIITSFIISIIMRFTNFIKDKTKVMYITIIFSILMIGLVTASFNSQDDFGAQGFENVLLKANGLAESISNSFVLIKPIMNTLLNYDNINGIKNLAIYVIENCICYILGIQIMSKIYLKGAIGTTINSQKTAKQNSQICIEDFKVKNAKKSYLAKEMMILKRTPIFFIQCFIMPIIYPIMILTIIMAMLEFAKAAVPIFEMKLYEILNSSFGIAVFLAIGQFIYMANFSSIIAVSRDSKFAKLMKYLPLDFTKQFKIKLHIGVTINLITAILVSICHYICIKNVYVAISVFIILTLLNYIEEKFKLLIDLKNPKMNWNSEYTMMKENTNVMYVLFYTVIVVGILLAISRFIVNHLLYLLLIEVSLLVINIFINNYIQKNKNQIFSKVY